MKGFIALLLLAQLAGVSAAFAVESGKPASGFRITGVAVGARDGAPVPFCRLRVYAVGPDSTPSEARASRFEDARAGGFDRDRGRRRRSEQAEEQDAVLADARGRFTIEAPGAGVWWLAGVARGYHLQAFEAHESFSATIVLTDATPTAAVMFRLQPDAGISGAIFDEAGEPVVGAQVQVEDAANVEAQPIHTLPTDDLGHYQFEGLAPGSYRVRVDARPWYASGGGGLRSTRVTIDSPNESSLDPSLDVVYATTWYPGSDTPGAAQALRLSGGEERQADFHLLPLPAAFLSVPRSPAKGREERGWAGPVLVRVALDAADQADRSNRFVEAAGAMRATGTTWEIGGLAPGTYDMSLPDSDEVRQVTVKAGGTVDFGAALPLLRVGLRFDGDAGDRAQVTLTAIDGGHRYVAGGGRPDYANMLLRSREGRPAGGPDASGLSVAVPAGRYRVAVTSGADTYLDGVSAEGARVVGEVVEVEHAASLTLKMADGRAQLRGVARLGVARLGDARAAAAMVLLVPVSGDAATLADRIVRAETSTDGSFVLGSVVPGPYILTVIDGGWQVNWRDARTLAEYLVHGVPVDLKPGGSQSVEVVAVRP